MERNYRNPNPRDREAERPKLPELKSDWIKHGLTKESVVYASTVGKMLADGKLTTSQIRTLFGEMRRIQLNGFQKEFTAFLMLKPKMAYASKRHENGGMKDFQRVINDCWDLINKDDKEKGKTEFDNFMNLFEAILAYHKSFGGK
jgi:CRISPR-associated protein Csm2